MQEPAVAHMKNEHNEIEMPFKANFRYPELYYFHCWQFKIPNWLIAFISFGFHLNSFCFSFVPLQLLDKITYSKQIQMYV